MNEKIVISTLILLSFLVNICIADGPNPGFPEFQRFKGTVKYDNGQDVEDGTSVTAEIDGDTYSTTVSDGTYGYEEEFQIFCGNCSYSGKTIYFYVNEVNTNQSVIFTSTETTILNLTIPYDEENGGNGGSPPTPNTNNPPVANAGGPYETAPGSSGLDIYFDASESYDPDGDIVGYRWDFENDEEFDTEWLTSPTTNHNYPESGEYTARLEVKDNENATDNDTATVIVGGTYTSSPPIADSNGPYMTYTFQGITFDGSQSYDPDGEIQNYTWTIGNDITLFGEKPVYNFSSSGNFTLILSVRDDEDKKDNDTTYIKIILDSDADLLSDEIEDIVNSDKYEKTNFLIIDISGNPNYLIDTNNDGEYNKFYDDLEKIATDTEKTENGTYLIDADGDNYWDFVYDDAKGLSKYQEEQESELPLLYIVLPIVIILIVLLSVFVAFNRKKKPLKNKINIRCPECKHVFPVVKKSGETKIICPKCGKKGTLKKD